MQSNTYDGLVTADITRLITRRARRLKFRADQIGDLQQRIVLHVLAFRYDPSRCNGASRRTALIALIDRQLLAVARAEDRYGKRVERVRQQALATVGHGCEPAAPTPPTDLVLDVREAIARLTPDAQQICKAMSEQWPATRIAQTLGVSRKRVRQMIHRIRLRFIALGLEAWIAPTHAAEVAHA